MIRLIRRAYYAWALAMAEERLARYGSPRNRFWNVHTHVALERERDRLALAHARTFHTFRWR
jgi:hypothetical protein